VMDQGNPHHAKALHHDLQVVKKHVEVFWLPHDSPGLNLIEILWRHLKRSRMANALFRSFRQFATHLDDLLSDFAMQPDLTLRIVTPNCRVANRKHLLLGTQLTGRSETGRPTG